MLLGQTPRVSAVSSMFQPSRSKARARSFRSALCTYVLQSHTIPDQHFAQIGTSPTPPNLSPWPAACYHSSHASSRTVYYHILIVFMLNLNVVQVPYFAWSVTLAEACRVGDSNFNCQIGSVACDTCRHEPLCSSV